MFKLKVLKTGLISTILFATFYVFYSNLNMNYFESFELKTYDLRYKMRELLPVKQREYSVVIVGIDEKSLVDIGRWPWKRTVHAKLLNKLKGYKVKSVGFDVSFSEFGPDEGLISIKDNLKAAIGEGYYGGRLEENLAVKLLNEINKIETDEDYIFAKAIKNSNNVVIGTYNILSKGEKISKVVEGNSLYLQYRYPVEGIMEELLKRNRISKEYFSPFEVYKIVPPIPIISENVKGIAPYEVGYPDPDGVLRGISLVTKEGYLDGKVYFPSLYLLTYLTAYNFTVDKNVILNIDNGTIKIILDNGKLFRTIPTNVNGYQRLFFYENKNRFNYYSYIDVLNDKISKDKFKDKIVLVGYTDSAKGLYDLRATPLSPNLPGVELHATAIQNLIDNKFMERKEIIPNFLCILLINLIVTLLLSLKKVNIKWTNLLVLLVLSSFLLWNFFMFTKGKWFELFYPFLTYFINYLLLSIKNYFDEEIEKKYIRNTFSNYISPKLVEELIKKPEMLKLGGEKRELTCFFSDIEGFTSISEKLQPEELVELLNEYLSAMSNIIIENRGTIDKYIGDAIMAIFGAPVISENSAKDACLSAVKYQKRLEMLRKEKNINLFARIGINTGMMIVGNMGCSIGDMKRFDYTVMGDEVNLASRLESINKYYGTYIMISENTYEQIKDDFIVRIVDFVKVKGKEKPVKIYELIELQGNADENILDKIKKFEEAIDLYRMRDWDSAIRIFSELASKYNDKASFLYLERVKYFKNNPPPSDWDFSYAYNTK